jgi:hypothetical protein
MCGKSRAGKIDIFLPRHNLTLATKYKLTCDIPISIKHIYGWELSVSHFGKLSVKITMVPVGGQHAHWW